MLIKFLNAAEDGNFSNPLRWGDGDDVHVAVCSMYALKIYEEAFMEDPVSKHHSLINDLRDTNAKDGTFSSFLGIDWDVDMRAAWAMLRAGDVSGRNKDVKPIPNYDELIKAHAGDTIDFYDLHMCVEEESGALFRSLSARLAEIEREQKQEQEREE